MNPTDGPARTGDRTAPTPPAGSTRYDSPVRRAQAARTRERIVAAGAELVTRNPAWDWSGVTIGAVADLAEVNRRTVYRHFASEQQLRTAIRQHLARKAGVSFEGMRLDDFVGLSGRVFRCVGSTPLEPWKDRDQAFHLAEEDRRIALAAAVGSAGLDLSADGERVVASLLDLLCGVDSLDHLVSAWDLDAADAADGLLWLMRVLLEAVEAGRAPGGPSAGPPGERATAPGSVRPAAP